MAKPTRPTNASDVVPGRRYLYAKETGTEVVAVRVSDQDYRAFLVQFPDGSRWEVLATDLLPVPERTKNEAARRAK